MEKLTVLDPNQCMSISDRRAYRNGRKLVERANRQIARYHEEETDENIASIITYITACITVTSYVVILTLILTAIFK